MTRAPKRKISTPLAPIENLISRLSYLNMIVDTHNHRLPPVEDERDAIRNILVTNKAVTSDHAYCQFIFALNALQQAGETLDFAKNRQHEQKMAYLEKEHYEEVKVNLHHARQALWSIYEFLRSNHSFGTFSMNESVYCLNPPTTYSPGPEE